MIPKSREDAEIALKACASASGDRFDLTAFAIAAAIHENPDRDVGLALSTLETLTSLARQQVPRTAQEFAMLLFAELGFTGGHDNYDDPAKADIISILQTRTGLPIGLGHIWRHAARAIDVPLHGTDTPGHFIMRLERDAAPVFIDPFDGGAILDADGLNDIARRAQLPSLSARMLAPVADRVMAVRLQTNLVARAKARGDDQAWFRAAFRRACLAPQTYQVASDFAQAAEAAGHLKTALEWTRKAVNLPGAPQTHSNHIQTLTQKLN